MKIPVKVKATGDIVDVDISVATAGNPLYTTSGGVTYLGDELEPAEPDWNQFRIQAAIAAMNGYQSAPIIPGCDPNPSQEEVARWSVQLADALIAELQKKGGEQ